MTINNWPISELIVNAIYIVRHFIILWYSFFEKEKCCDLSVHTITYTITELAVYIFELSGCQFYSSACACTHFFIYSLVLRIVTWSRDKYVMRKQHQKRMPGLTNIIFRICKIEIYIAITAIQNTIWHLKIQWE